MFFYFLAKILGKIKNKKELLLKLFRPFIILAEKIDVEDNGIEPLYAWRIWNDFDDLTGRQVASFEFISKAIYSNKRVDIGNSIGYLYLFLFESTKKLLMGSSYNEIINDLCKLRDLYKDNENVAASCDFAIADIYLCFDEPHKYIEIIEKYIDGKYISTQFANKIINVKYILHEEVTPKELFSINNKLTKLGQENIYDILCIANNIMRGNREFSQNIIINDIAKKDLQSNKYRFPLFEGNPYGKALAEKLLAEKYLNNYVCFYANEDFLNIVNELSRESENLFRESKGIPRVGEGWVNETNLYYKLKSYFQRYTLIHQYRSNWLGLQSIDIFIKEYNIGIEYQGIQHYRAIEFFGGEEGFKRTVERDKRKKILCKTHGIWLVYLTSSPA